MQSSASIVSLAEALSKAQGELKPLAKSKEAKIPGKEGKTGYSYSYADLADVIECFRPALAKHGLSVIQPITMAAEGHLVLLTRLLHSSGEWIESEYPLKSYDRPQEQGSAITYARRYALTALLGIAAEDDDDGKRAQDAEPAKEQPVSGDAGAILDLAAELEQITGQSVPVILKNASLFMGKEEGGTTKPVFFEDPRTVKSIKWLKGVRAKLEKELQSKGATAAVGDEPLPF
jgi:hypothetical protein